jgi:hypothetical protein
MKDITFQTRKLPQKTVGESLHILASEDPQPNGPGELGLVALEGDRPTSWASRNTENDAREFRFPEGRNLEHGLMLLGLHQSSPPPTRHINCSKM